MANSNDINKLYNKAKMTAKQAKNIINESVNGPKKATKSYKFPTKEVQEKLAKAQKIDKAIKTVGKVGNTLKTAGKVGLGGLSTWFGIDSLRDAHNLQKQSIEAASRGDYEKSVRLANKAAGLRAQAYVFIGLPVGGAVSRTVGRSLKGAGNIARKAIGPMGKKVANELVDRGVSKAAVDLMRKAPIRLRKTGAFFDNVGSKILSYPGLAIGGIAGSVLGPATEFGYNLFNNPKEELDVNGDDYGSDQPKPTPLSDKDWNGTGDKGTLTDSGKTDLTKYGYEDPNAVNSNYYSGGTSSFTGGANVVPATGTTTSIPQTTTTVNPQSIANQQSQDANSDNKPQEEQSRFTDFVNRANDVYDSWQRSQQYYDPYRNSLNQYINDYRDIYDASMARNRWLSALRGESINPDKFSPLDEEANRIALQKQLASDLEAQENSRNELIGNLGVASEMGLPPESVNATDKYLQSATKYREEEDKIEQRRENQRLKYQTNLEIQQLKGEVQRDIAAGNLRAAAAKVELLKQKNQILYTLGLFTPAINAMPYMDDYSTLLDIMGRTPVGQYFVPQQQIQPVQQVQVQARPQQPKTVNRAISADQFVQRFK